MDVTVFLFGKESIVFNDVLHMSYDYHSPGLYLTIITNEIFTFDMCDVLRVEINEK